jgi:hypothetical protein
LIIGLVVGLIVLLQACSAFGLSSMGEALGDERSAGLATASAGGVLTGLLVMVGAGFVMPFPRVAAVVLALAGLVGLGIGLSTEFSDQAVWGGVALVLAVMAWFGARGKRRDDAAKAEERANLAAMADRARAESAEPTKVCPNCAERIKEAAVQCRYCGHKFVEEPTA